MGLTSLNINNVSINEPTAINDAMGNKRKKYGCEEGNLEAAGEVEVKLDELGSKGCGRVLCRGCCEENWQRLVCVFVFRWILWLLLLSVRHVEVLKGFSSYSGSTCLDCYDRI